MNKKELVAAVAAKTEMTQASVEKALKALVEVTVAEVAKKGKVQLIGFGTQGGPKASGHQSCISRIADRGPRTAADC